MNKVLYDGFIKVEGIETKGKVWEKINLQGGVAAVVFNPKGEIVLVKQYRVPRGEYTYEIPAGNLDKPELTPKETIIEELVEECELDPEYLTLKLDDSPFVKYMSLPAIADADMGLFIGYYNNPNDHYLPKKIQNDDVESIEWIDIDLLVEKIIFDDIKLDSTTITNIMIAKYIKDLNFDYIKGEK